MIRPLILGLLCFFSFCLSELNPIHAQVLGNYQGPYQFRQMDGMADYNLILIEDDTLFDGRFSFESANSTDLITETDHYFSFSGSFDKNTPLGTWQLSEGTYSQASHPPKVINGFYQVPVNGERTRITGNLASGLLDGNWVQSVVNIEKSLKRDTSFWASFTFDQGVPQGNFEINSSRGNLLGMFLRDGRPNNVWLLTNGDQTEQWNFSDGKLIGIDQGDLLGTNSSIDVFSDSSLQSISVQMDQRYLEIIRLNSIMNSDTLSFDDESWMGSKLLEQSFHLFEKFESNLNELVSGSYYPDIKVLVPHQPLSDKDNNQITKISQWTEESIELTDDLLSSTQLNILSLAEEEVAFQLAVLSKFQNDYLPFLQWIDHYYDAGALPFVDKTNILERLWPGNKDYKTLEIEYEFEGGFYSNTYLNEIIGNKNMSEKGIAALHSFANYVYQSIKEIKSDLDSRARKEERRKELEELEKQLILSVDSMSSLEDSLSASLPKEFSQPITAIRKSARKDLVEYSGTQGVENKMMAARDLLNCYKEKTELIVSVASLPDKKKEIEEVYRDEVWNPFTSTIMEEQVKSRITNVYFREIIPQALSQIEDGPTCARASNLLNILNKSYNRILELREEDTKVIERRLRKADDLPTKLKLMDLDITFTEL